MIERALMLHSATLPGAHSSMRYLLLMLTLVLVTGCGSKGPLFLPKDESADSQPASTQSEPAQPEQAQPTETPDEIPSVDELPAEEQATPKEFEQEPFPEPAEEQEDEDDVNL